MQPIQLTENTGLLVIDVQDRLMSAMPEDPTPDFLKFNRLLVSLADDMGAPVVYTEQYPDGLGSTEESLAEALRDAGASRIEKTQFDACRAPDDDAIGALPHDIVVTGIEAHICVLSTARSLVEAGHRVVVPFDAVLSRREPYLNNGLELLRQAGVQIANTETILYDTLQDSQHDLFKKYSRLIR
jgi:nicotinamidase-related amidase